MLHAVGKLRPCVPRRFVNRHRRRGKIRIGECPGRKEIPVRPNISVPIQGGSTIGAEVESNLASSDTPRLAPEVAACMPPARSYARPTTPKREIMLRHRSMIHGAVAVCEL